MKKDVSLAVLVGFLLGALTAIVIVNLPSIIKRVKRGPKTDVAQVTPTQIPSRIAKNQIELTVNKPLDQTIVSSKKISLSGKSNAGNTLVLETDLDIDVKESSSDGTFSFPVSLSEGGNTILVTAYDKNGQSEAKTLTIFYTSEEL